MFFQGIGKGGTGLNIGPDLHEYFFESRVFLLIAEYLQALDEGKTGIDHGGELPGENNHILAGHLWLKKLNILQHILGFLLEFRRSDPDLFQMGAGSFNIGRLENPFSLFTV